MSALADGLCSAADACHPSIPGVPVSLHDRLHASVRATVGKRRRTTAAVMDSQMVCTAPRGGSGGYDADKETKGRNHSVLRTSVAFLVPQLERRQLGHDCERTGTSATAWIHATTHHTTRNLFVT